MSRAYVQFQERDLSSYVSENSTIGVGMIVIANKGKRNTILKFSKPDQILKSLTPNEAVMVGDNTSIFSALIASAKTGSLYVVVPEAKNVKYAGLILNASGIPTSVNKGIDNPESFTHSGSVLIAASSQGVWGNDLYVRVINYKDTQTISESFESTKDTVKTFTFNLTDDMGWADGYPITIYGKLAEELDTNTRYFIGGSPNGFSSTSGKYALYSSMNDAANKTNPVLFSKLDKGTLISPAVMFTRLPNTSCIQVFQGQDLNNPVAEYVVSTKQDAKDNDRNNIYIEEVLSGTEYIQAAVNHSVSTNGQLAEFLTPTRLGHGHNGDPITTGDMIKAVRLFNSTNDVKITLFGDGGYTVPAFHDRLRTLCQTRGDCVPILSAPLSAQKNKDTSASDVVNWRKFEQNIDSSWAALYSPHIKIYDEFNDREVWVAPDGFVIDAILTTAANYELWYPVAGNKRGMVKALDTKVHYTDGDQDLLYDNGINPIIFEAGKGIKIWGQKTLQSQPSMLDRLNVRLLMVTIGPAITELLRDFLFEFNDAPTRAEAKVKVESYMESIKSRRGVTSFTVICDESNNSKHDIDNHIMRLWLIICPNSSVEKIVFPIAITNNSAKLETVYQQI